MKKAKILIIDDSEKDILLLKDYLMVNEYEVVTTNDPGDALNQIKAQNPDLVVMDINMPDQSGWKTCDKIKNDPLLGHIPILMCSASIEDDGDFSAYQTGDAYIQKPINLLNLLAMIQKLLDKRSSGN